MNSSKTLLVAGLGLGFAGVIVASAIYLFRSPPSEAPTNEAAESRKSAAPLFVERTEAQTPALQDTAKTVEPSPPSDRADANKTTTGGVPQSTAGGVPEKPRYKPGPSKFKKAKEPMARVALEFVGADPESERVWLAAINDESVPADERKDLIEDLNEDGISDPKNPTRQDLGLIQSRITLIEQLLPSAMDKTNADAFREAHKDLVNMNSRLTGK
jgi:hypothetical protein